MSRCISKMNSIDRHRIRRYELKNKTDSNLDFDEIYHESKANSLHSRQRS